MSLVTQRCKAEGVIGWKQCAKTRGNYILELEQKLEAIRTIFPKIIEAVEDLSNWQFSEGYIDKAKKTDKFVINLKEILGDE